ncbi:universal stress protein [Apilactobacillus timberlakei]|uniref:Universal stress protein n=1 Tax=Apilactobacillus timberlakei TaxID=2008380 RepID=A0ABY2YWF5_9LACO|nr:universal stress protein [Apilactobacillus timberlakei]TPR12661.1 universal stress protein [Apilactobacillus timberlakei]TPR13490.1 universal stress protein [Apilactobacillus timberlakei]TPR15563.1 universal stress protein [Apilactobacillus timberlakei]TPR17811.1 universal stress protein [Apilactobacillus timberlakei]TPR22760.1 universal stress protein [Apilactobacillus timberlakei]
MLKNYEQILVPIDGSKYSKLAFNKAVEVAKRNNASLHIAHVIDTRVFNDLATFDTSMLDELTSDAKKTLDKYKETAIDSGVNNVDYVIEYGMPKSIIAKDLVKRFNIDLIMIGANGKNMTERILIGSVASYVTRSASCDVLMVKTDVQNKE